MKSSTFAMMRTIACGCLYGLLASGSSAYGQILQRQAKSSTTSNFSYQITSTIGTQTSANVSGNLKAVTEAVLRLQAGSLITNKIGDENGNASAIFTTSPNGSNVNLTGVTGENLFVIDDGTSFRSKLETIDNPDLSQNSTGEASAIAIQSTMVEVQSGSTSFISAFQQAF